MTDNEKMLSYDPKTLEKNAASKARVKKKRFTVLDFGFVVILLLSILGIGFRTVIAEWIVKTVPQETVTLSFKTEGMTAEVAQKLKENDVFFANGEQFGTLGVFELKTGKKIVETVDDEGRVSFVEAEDRTVVTAVGEMMIEGHYTENGFVCQDEMNLYVGKMLIINTSSYSITVVITEIPRK